MLAKFHGTLPASRELIQGRTLKNRKRFKVGGVETLSNNVSLEFIHLFPFLCGVETLSNNVSLEFIHLFPFLCTYTAQVRVQILSESSLIPASEIFLFARTPR